ncbi:MAG: hypothetical protein Q4C42_07125 [Clostridia bacterium]|nr:hypothetical protein [Clostridia bacterium]
MDEFFLNWFKAFGDGLLNIDEESCGKLFSSCASVCAKDAVKYLYRDLFNECGGKPDEFFIKLNKKEGLGGEVVEPGRVYDIIFKSCGCPLHTDVGVNTPKLCECSKMSTKYIMKSLSPEDKFTVEKIGSILGGDKVCRFRITRCENE